MTIEAGQVLHQRYRLIRPLGQGSQASVWVAEHLALSTLVAVKLIDLELAKKEEALDRFRGEATAAAQLRSANVVQILDHGVEGAQPFIVMELLEGEDLFERLERRRRLSLQETSRIVTQVSRALARAHAAGIIHRDLKPENFFIVTSEDDEVVKVLDFGVAKVSDPAKQTMKRTSVGTLIGTPHYMSPEQVKGIGEVDHRTDLWALGVIAYQCVTGELPFDSEGVGDLLIRISMGEMPVPSKARPDLPPAFDAWFARACDRDAARRFASARDLAESLARVSGLSTESASASSGESVVPKPPASQPRPSGSIPAAATKGPAVAASPGAAAKPRGTLASLDLEEVLEEQGEELEGSEEIAEAKAAPAHRSKPPRPAFESHEIQFEGEASSEGRRTAPGGPAPVRSSGPAASASQPPLSPPLGLPVRPPVEAPRIALPVGRSLPSSTVSGLASMSTPPELDGNERRRKLTRYFMFALLALTGGVVWIVVRSQIPPKSPAALIPPPASAEPVAGAGSPLPSLDPLVPSASTSAGQAVDPGRLSSGVAPIPPRPKPTSRPRPKKDDMTIEIPLPAEDLPPAP